MPIGISSITLLDLGASYDTKIAGYDATITAMCYNVFNKNYWYASGDNSVGLGAPRNFMVTANFKLCNSGRSVFLPESFKRGFVSV